MGGKEAGTIDCDMCSGCRENRGDLAGELEFAKPKLSRSESKKKKKKNHRKQHVGWKMSKRKLKKQ